MSDYRNAPIKFAVAGVDLNLPPEGLKEATWRKLDNIRVLRETVMEGRMHVVDLFTSNYVYRKDYALTTDFYPGGTGIVRYPDSYYLGPLVYFTYVGPLKDGTPGFLSIHQNTAAMAWPNETQAEPYFTCFLNGMPIVEVHDRSLDTIAVPLTTSLTPPSVVRILAPNGPPRVIIDGRWVITPGMVDPNNLDKSWLPLHQAVYLPVQVLDGGTLHPSRVPMQLLVGGTWVDGLIPVPAFRISPGLDPYGVTVTAISVSVTTTATVPATGVVSGTYQYTVTYSNKRTGTRSAAYSTYTTCTDTATNAANKLTLAWPADGQNDQIEVWRRGGTIGDSFRLVTTLTDSSLSSSNITPAYVTTYDLSADSQIALNEALDPLLVRPFPTIDKQGNSYTLLDPVQPVYSTGYVVASYSSTLVTGVGTVSAANAPNWTPTSIVGYNFRLYNDASHTPYIIKTATAATTAASAQLVLSKAITNTLITGTNTTGLYRIDRDYYYPISFGPFLGQYIFWVGDPIKKANFYWSNQGKPNLSSADLNFNAVTDPGEELVNGCMYGDTPLMFSRRKLYALDYAGPEASPTFTAREIPLGLGLSVRTGLAATRAGVFFVNYSGIYGTDAGGGPPTLLSEALQPLFFARVVDDNYPIDWTYPDKIRLIATTRELHFFFQEQTTAAIAHWVFDLNGQRWMRWRGDFTYATELENTGNYVLVLGGTTSKVSYTDDLIRENGAETFTATARTGSWDAGIPLTDKDFGVLMLDFDPDGANISITPRFNSDTEVGTTIYTGTSGDTNGRRTSTYSLGDIFRRSMSLEFSWTETSTAHPQFYQGQVLFREDEEGIVHWFIPPTSLGNGGWFHVKDSYWTLRSTAAVTLSVTVDGVTDTYSIPSTSGLRVKNYVEFKPRKGKLFSFTMDSSQPFFFYGEESQVLGKPWKSGTKYAPLNVFQAAGYAQYLRNEGGT